MGFEKFRRKSDKLWFEHRNRLPHQPGEAPQEERDRFYALYMAYSSKKLVLATWALAIGTLILSALTIYFQYIKK